MPIRQHFTIGRLMIGTGLLAVDFALFRAAWGDAGLLKLVVASVPCLNFIILLAPRAWRPGPRRPFWTGFVATETLVTLGFATNGRFPDSVIYRPADLAFERMAWFYQLQLPVVILISRWPILYAAIYTTPMLLLAGLGGWLTQHYRGLLRLPRRSDEAVDSTRS